MKPEPTNKPEAPMSWEQALDIIFEEEFARPYNEAVVMQGGNGLRYEYEKAALLFGESCFNRGAREHLKSYLEGIKNEILPKLIEDGNHEAAAFIRAMISKEEESPFPAPEFKA